MLKKKGEMLNYLPCQLVFIDQEAQISYLNNAFLEEGNHNKEDLLNKKILSIWPEHTLPKMLDAPPCTRLMFMDEENFCIQGNVWENHVLLGAIQLNFPSTAFQSPADSFWGGSYDNLDNDIKAIFSSSYDVIYASNGEGITQKVSSACAELWGMQAEDLIGKSVFQLEQEGVYYPSITRLVLETKQRVQCIQTTRTGRKLMVIGNPIFNQEGEILQVINLSRDITSEKNMRTELDSIKMLLDAYKHELDELRSKNLENNKFIYASEAMTYVARMALKVSDVDSTVLITGESGVGKEVISSFIQANSLRKDKQFIKINCSAIPETLLESELFGYEKGAFTGASKEGKLGLFELANHGTLFLDEISEIPLNMQVKLLRVLQEGVLLRLGGVKPCKVDVRIIAASNRNLEAEMAAGRFREDLYYRLNVVPIHIPPLRERREDILPLAMFFLQRYNKQYGKNKTLDTELIQRFLEYYWPGNIRELQNIVERLVVLAERETITTSDLPVYILANDKDNGVIVNRIMPLKDAVNSVEQQLIHLAMEKYGTTTRIAEVLGVDQSTISRKMRK
jgi:PAS domain S-box-containing protein